MAVSYPFNNLGLKAVSEAKAVSCFLESQGDWSCSSDLLPGCDRESRLGDQKLSSLKKRHLDEPDTLEPAQIFCARVELSSIMLRGRVAEGVCETKSTLEAEVCRFKTKGLVDRYSFRLAEDRNGFQSQLLSLDSLDLTQRPRMQLSLLVSLNQ
jgi:hypothetical protein